MYREWAKMEECWNAIKDEDLKIDLDILKADLINNSSVKRKRLTEDEVNNLLITAELDFVKSIPLRKWQDISRVGVEIEDITQHLIDRSINIQSSLRLNKILSETQRKDALKIIEIILDSSPNFFDAVSELQNEQNAESGNKINKTLLTKMVAWDTNAKGLSAKELLYVADFAYGLKKLNSFHEIILNDLCQGCKKQDLDYNTSLGIIALFNIMLNSKRNTKSVSPKEMRNGEGSE